MKNTLFSVMVTCLVVTLVTPICLAAPVSFSDGIFNNMDWSAIKIVDSTPGQGATFTAGQVPDGGNPHEYRYVTHSYDHGGIHVAHLYWRAFYDASVQGAISTIDYSYDLIHINPPSGKVRAVGYGLLLFQGGYYYRYYGDIIFDEEWTEFGTEGLTASDFIAYSSSGPEIPDFSATGWPIYFGYVSANSTESVQFRKSGIDNWTVSVNPVPDGPTADAGPDQTVEQASYDGTEVTLDASGSTDPDSTPGTNDDIVSFEWYEGDALLGSGEIINYTFPLGTHTVTLAVTDSSGEEDDDEVIITVQDTTPPDVSVSVGTDSLWPPNHKMIDVGFSFEVSDICDPEPEVSIEVTSDEPTATAPDAGGPKHAPDAEITDDDRVLLRAERSGEADGRVYVITVTATDESGNVASSSVFVKVNHDTKEEAIDSGQNYDATQIN